MLVRVSKIATFFKNDYGWGFEKEKSVFFHRYFEMLLCKIKNKKTHILDFEKNSIKWSAENI